MARLAPSVFRLARITACVVTAAVLGGISLLPLGFTLGGLIARVRQDDVEGTPAMMVLALGAFTLYGLWRLMVCMSDLAPLASLVAFAAAGALAALQMGGGDAFILAARLGYSAARLLDWLF